MEDINTLTQKANSGDAVAMRKLGVHNSLEAIRLGQESGLLS